MPATAPIPSLLLYRSVACGHAWDQFEPHYDHATGAQYLLRACAPKASSTMAPEAHIMMGFYNHVRSPYISFSCSLDWAVYYHLLEEHFRKTRRPDKSQRKLYAVKVVAEDIPYDAHYKYECQRARAFAGVAQEFLGHGQVRVMRMVKVVIPQWLEAWSSTWFASQYQYPYHTWKNELIKQEGGKMYLDMVEGFVKLWELGVTQEQARRIPLPADNQD